MRCASCLLLDPASDALTAEEHAARLAGCDECPIERGDAPCPPEAAARLMRRQRELDRALRRSQSKLRQARNELEEMRAEMLRSEQRVAALEALQQANSREIAGALRAQIELVQRQQDAILSLSTPIIQVWSGILVLPLVGALDAARADALMSGLLESVVARGARHAILDLTGVSEVDGPRADHLLRVVRAARLLGAEVLLSGMRPQVARAVADLDLRFEGLRTASSLEEALRACGVGRAPRAAARSA